MLVPETAVNKNHFASADEHHIRPSGQVFPVQPVPVSQTVNKTSNRKLGFQAFAANAAHVLAAAFWCELIHGRE